MRAAGEGAIVAKHADVTVHHHRALRIDEVVRPAASAVFLEPLRTGLVFGLGTGLGGVALPLGPEIFQQARMGF